MKSVFAVLAAGMAMILTNPAQAQQWAQQGDDDQDPNPQLTAVEGFGGLHVEASVGYDHLKIASIQTISNTIAQTQGTAHGVTFGGAIGYDLPVTDRVLIGAELGIYGSTAKFNNAANLIAGTFDTSQVNPKPDVYVGGRVGYVLNRKTEVYVKAGLSSFHLSAYGTDGSETLNQSVSATGLRGGAGIERQLTKTTYVKIEGDYTHYGSGTYNFGNATPNASVYDLRGNREQALLSFGYRF